MDLNWNSSWKILISNIFNAPAGNQFLFIGKKENISAIVFYWEMGYSSANMSLLVVDFKIWDLNLVNIA